MSDIIHLLPGSPDSQDIELGDRIEAVVLDRPGGGYTLRVAIIVEGRVSDRHDWLVDSLQEAQVLHQGVCAFFDALLDSNEEIDDE